MEFNHTSVLLNESIEGLNIKPEGIYVDGTLGGAGHASVVAGRLTGKGRLIGFDWFLFSCCHDMLGNILCELVLTIIADHPKQFHLTVFINDLFR